MFVCDYSQFFPDRYDDPRFEVPEYVMVWGNNPVVANSDGTLRPLDRGMHEARVEDHLAWIRS